MPLDPFIEVPREAGSRSGPAFGTGQQGAWTVCQLHVIHDLDPAGFGREALLSHLTFLTLLWMVCGFTEGLSFLVFQGLLGTDPRLTFAHVKENKSEKKNSTATEQAGLMRALGLVVKTRAWQESVSKLPLLMTFQDASEVGVVKQNRALQSLLSIYSHSN